MPRFQDNQRVMTHRCRATIQILSLIALLLGRYQVLAADARIVEHNVRAAEVLRRAHENPGEVFSFGDVAERKDGGAAVFGS